MPKVTPIGKRKNSHLRINLEEDVRSGITTGLEDYHFIHQSLPDLNLSEIDLGLSVFQKRLSAPILISSMTGGTPEAKAINQHLAYAAQATGVAMGIGSQRAGIDNPILSDTFRVRQVAPDILLFGNLGAVQLNYGYGIEQCQRAVDMIEADALILHFNPLQEAVQPEGNTQFKGLLTKIEEICRKLLVPVVAKEVGWGFSEQAARQLCEVGVAAIDVAGAGGTSWSQVEMYRAEDEPQRRLANAFINWGIPTAQAILNVRNAAPDVLIFASGGLLTGIDIAKCIALGATLGGMTAKFLKAAVESPEAILQAIDEIKREIQVCMFAAGTGNLAQLSQISMIKSE